MMAIQVSRLAKIFVAPLLLLISACAPLGLDYQRPNVALPSAYNQSDAVAAKLCKIMPISNKPLRA